MRDSNDNRREYSEEDIRRMGDYARRILYPTPEEKAELEAKCRKLEAQFEHRTAERRRKAIAAQNLARKPKKLKFFGIGWWYE